MSLQNICICQSFCVCNVPHQQMVSCAKHATLLLQSIDRNRKKIDIFKYTFMGFARKALVDARFFLARPSNNMWICMHSIEFMYPINSFGKFTFHNGMDMASVLLTSCSKRVKKNLWIWVQTFDLHWPWVEYTLVIGFCFGYGTRCCQCLFGFCWCECGWRKTVDGLWTNIRTLHHQEQYTT